MTMRTLNVFAALAALFVAMLIFDGATARYETAAGHGGTDQSRARDAG